MGRKEERDTPTSAGVNADSPNYPKPKILLIDMPEEAVEPLQQAGLNASWGTFGSPYKIEPPRIPFAIGFNDHLPDYTEQEVVIIDLTKPAVSGTTPQVPAPNPREMCPLAERGTVIVNPRPYVMANCQGHFDRMLKHGSLFVIFGQPRETAHFISGTYNGSYWQYLESDHLNLDNWSFLGCCQDGQLHVFGDCGQEVAVAKEEECPLTALLSRHMSSCRFQCAFQHHSPQHHAPLGQWRPLLRNKYAATVAAVYQPQGTDGAVLLLPQIEDKVTFTADLVQNVLPDMFPKLFPDHGSGRWVHENEYQLEGIRVLKGEKEKAAERANAEIKNLDEQIEAEWTRWEFLYDILTKDAKELVNAVKTLLGRVLQFQDVRDVDEELQAASTAQKLREDLQVWEANRTLLLEIKGTSDLPKEMHVSQLVKFLNRRKSEWNRTNVHGVLIVNHQRFMPGLVRKGLDAFTDEQIRDAELQGIGLVTTWELFLLATGVMHCGWDPGHVRALFHQPGRILRIPAHYQLIGKVVHCYPKPEVVEICLEAKAQIAKGDRLGYELPTGFEEETITAMRVDDKEVDFSSAGQAFTIRTEHYPKVARKNTPVYRVTKTCSPPEES